MEVTHLLLAVPTMALALAQQVLPPYSHPKSPHQFTQPQLLACLIVKAYLRQTYRGIVELLALSDGLRQAWKLQRVPDHSTLQKFSQRAVHPEGIDRWLAQLLEWVRPAAEIVAMDATGWESTPSSAYYQTRRGQRRKGYVQVSRLILCGSLLPCGVEIGRGPCNGKRAARPLLAKASAQVRPQPLVADAGYDAAWVHEFCRERWRVSSWIPLAVHSGDGQVRGRWRSQRREMPKVYRQRWHVGSFLSGLKRTTGSRLTAWR